MSALCGPLDLGGGAPSWLPPDTMHAAKSAARGGGFVKVQRRRHERLESLHALEALRRDHGLCAPALLDSGAVDGGWWAAYERVEGQAAQTASSAEQRALGAQLRRWHDHGAISSLRLDAPGALAVFLGTARARVPEVYPALAARLDAACRGQPMCAMHGDVAVTHNTLWQGGALAAIFDPGGVDVGPPMLDLAVALAMDLPCGGAVDPLLAGYGTEAVDRAALDAFLPVMLLRRLVDAVELKRAADARWLEARLQGDALLGATLRALFR